MGDEEPVAVVDPLVQIETKYEPIFQEKLALRAGIASQLGLLGSEFHDKLNLLTKGAGRPLFSKLAPNPKPNPHPNLCLTLTLTYP